MSTARAIAQNTAIQISGKAVSTLLGLAAIAMMTRYLGVEKFGWYITAIGFLQFVGIFSDGQFHDFNEILGRVYSLKESQQIRERSLQA